MLGFKQFRHATVTIAGSGLMHRIRKGWFGIRHLCSRGLAPSAMWERTAPSINVAQCVRAPYACRFIQKDPRERLGLRSKARRQFRRDRLLCEQIFLAVSHAPNRRVPPQEPIPFARRLEARRSTDVDRPASRRETANVRTSGWRRQPDQSSTSGSAIASHQLDGLQRAQCLRAVCFRAPRHTEGDTAWPFANRAGLLPWVVLLECTANEECPIRCLALYEALDLGALVRIEG